MPTGTVLDGVRDWIENARRELAVPAPAPLALRRRLKLLDRLERHLLDPIVSTEASLYDQAMAARSELEEANERAYDSIRSAIRRGEGSSTLHEWLARPRLSPNADDHDGYDVLDEIIAGALALEEPGPTSVEPTAEMVFYQPTPARHILDLFDRASLTPDDVLMDLGSGLGHIALLTAICTPARSIGVELEPAYVACARGAAAALNLTSVTFIEGDARAVSLDDATIYFLYTPFSGQILRTMLERMRRQAETRDVRVCTYGPVTETIAAEDWLAAEEPVRAGRVAIFRRRPRTR